MYMCVCMYMHFTRTVCVCAPLDLRIYVLTRHRLVCSSSQLSRGEYCLRHGLLWLRWEFSKGIPQQMFFDSESCSTLFEILLDFFALLWLLYMYMASYKTARYQISPAGLLVDLSARLPIFCLLVCSSLAIVFSAPDAESWHYLSSPDWLPQDNKCITIVDLFLLLFLLLLLLESHSIFR